MQCKAKAKASGKQCQRGAIPGGTVCIMHGGKAPQVQQSAILRLRALVNPAIDVMSKSMEDYVDDRTNALKAAFGTLDRNGMGPTTKHQVTGADGGPIDVNVSAGELLRGRIASLTSRIRPGDVAKRIDRATEPGSTD